MLRTLRLSSAARTVGWRPYQYCSRRAYSSETSQGTEGRVASAPYDILFCGSDEFASACLKSLYHAKTLWKSLAVVHPSGGRRPRALDNQANEPPVQTVAQEFGLPHEIVRGKDLRDWDLPAYFPVTSPSALLITASFGYLIPTRILERFPHPSQTLNVHPSLLPRLRGAAPLQWALARGLKHTGSTVQQLSHGKFDHGRVLGQVEFSIPPKHEYPELIKMAGYESSRLLLKVLSDLPAADAASFEQIGEPILAPKFGREVARIRWNEWTSRDVVNRHRAFSYVHPIHTTLLPHSSSNFKSKLDTVMLHNVSRLHPGERYRDRLGEHMVPGSARYIREAGGVVIKCASSSWIVARRLQIPGKKSQKAREWIIGYRDRGDKEGYLRFGDPDSAATAAPGAVDAKVVPADSNA